MKCLQPGLWTAALIGTLGLAQSVFASNNPLAGAMGNLRWGMRNHDVKSALKSELGDNSKVAGLEASYVEFDGSPSHWDKTPLAEEYTHGNDEAMMTVEDKDGARNYYFFIGGELWKWVKVYPASAFGGHDFSSFSNAIQHRFGKGGHAKQGEINAGSGKAYKFIEYVDRNTRVRAVDKLKQQGSYALVFESLGTVRSLASLRANSPRPGASARAMTAPESEESAPKAKASKRDSDDDAVASPSQGSSSTTKNRSIFSENGQDDSAKEEGGHNKARAQANARKAQQHGDDRAKPDQQTRNLDKLLGADDDDPLTGLPQ